MRFTISLITILAFSSIGFSQVAISYEGLLTQTGKSVELEFNAVSASGNYYFQWLSEVNGEEILITPQKAFYASSQYKPFRNRQVWEIPLGAFGGFAHCPFLITKGIPCVAYNGSGKNLRVNLPSARSGNAPVRYLLPATQDQVREGVDLVKSYQVSARESNISASITQSAFIKKGSDSFPSLSVENYKILDGRIKYEWKLKSEPTILKVPSVREFLSLGYTISDGRSTSSIQLKRNDLDFAFGFDPQGGSFDSQANEAYKEAVAYDSKAGVDTWKMTAVVAISTIVVSAFLYLRLRKRSK